MAKEQQPSPVVYNANGVEFTIYATTKPTKAGPKLYWVLVDYSTGKRGLLNNKTLKVAKQRADRIRAAMAKGQASRMSLSNPADVLLEDLTAGQLDSVVVSFGVKEKTRNEYRIWHLRFLAIVFSGNSKCS